MHKNHRSSLFHKNKKRKKRRRPIPLKKILAIQFLGFLLILLPLVLDIGWTRFTYYREIDIYLPKYHPDFFEKAIGYGAVSIIVDGDDRFYVHQRKEHLPAEIGKDRKAKEIRAGLTAPYVALINEKVLRQLIRNRLQENKGMICSISLTSSTTYGDLIHIIDLMDQEGIYRWSIRKMSQEEQEIINFKKRRERHSQSLSR